MKTWIANSENVEKKWWVVDASGKSLGRLTTQIASILRGKTKPTFTPNADTGDFVVVVNAEKVSISGDRWAGKTYYRHSRFFGSLKSFSGEEMLQKDPTFIIEDAVKGMLPKNRIARQIIKKLKIYAGPDHPHAAQRPEALEVPGAN